MKTARLGSLFVLTAVLVGAAAGTATAASPTTAHAPKGKAVVATRNTPIAARFHAADALTDYNNAISTEQAQETAAALAGAAVGAVVGLVPGCVLGGVMGLVVPPAEVISIPFGCVMGLVGGAGIGGVLGGQAAISSAEPGIWQKCVLAMPEWACQIQKNERLQGPPTT